MLPRAGVTGVLERAEVRVRIKVVQLYVDGRIICRSINQSKHICTAPYVASESEAPVSAGSEYFF